MDTGFGLHELYAACKLSIVHHYAPTDHTWKPVHGTGFIVQFPDGDNRFGLVTNRHLTDVPWHKAEYEGAKIHSICAEIWQSKNLRLNLTLAGVEPIYHVDPTIDIAIIPFGPKIDPAIKGTFYDKIENILPNLDSDILTFNHGFSWTYLLECEGLWPVLEAGEFVAFPGYPKWYDKLQTRPVLRSGMIASDPQTEYRRLDGSPTTKDGNQQVLFDAFSTSGNSGSPVFVSQKGIPPLPIRMIDTDGNNFSPYGRHAELKIEGYHRSFLIGINTGHINDEDSNNDHAGLSRLHKLSAIMEILRANTKSSAELPTARVLIRKNDIQQSDDDDPAKRDTNSARNKLIMALRHDGKTYSAIAAEVGCSASTVGKIVRQHTASTTSTG